MSKVAPVWMWFESGGIQVTDPVPSWLWSNGKVSPADIPVPEGEMEIDLLVLAAEDGTMLMRKPLP